MTSEQCTTGEQTSTRIVIFLAVPKAALLRVLLLQCFGDSAHSVFKLAATVRKCSA